VSQVLFSVVAGGQSAATVEPNPNKVSPGFAGFLVVFLLALATIVLIRSMTKHLRAVRYSPDPAEAAPRSADRDRGHRQGTGDVVDDQAVDPRRE
jgi:hypothetical protein